MIQKEASTLIKVKNDYSSFALMQKKQKIKIIPMKLLRTILFWYSMRSAAHRTSISAVIISWDHKGYIKIIFILKTLMYIYTPTRHTFIFRRNSKDMKRLSVQRVQRSGRDSAMSCRI